MNIKAIGLKTKGKENISLVLEQTNHNKFTKSFCNNRFGKYNVSVLSKSFVGEINIVKFTV